MGIPVRSKNSFMRSLAKWDPRSDLIIFGEPNRPKCCNKLSAADSALASLHQNISVYLEKASIMIRIYPLSGNGPT